MRSKEQQTREVTGVLVRYTTNKHNDIDGMILDQQGGSTDVKFPPHTARFVREVAAEGDQVHLVLHDKPHPPHHPHKRHGHRQQLVSIGNGATNRQFTIDSVKPPHPPETGGLVTFTIPKPQFTRGGKHEEINGVVFEDKFIHLHPEEYEAEEAALAAAAVLRVKAKKRMTDAGFVNADGYAVYHAHSLTIGEK